MKKKYLIGIVGALSIAGIIGVSAINSKKANESISNQQVSENVDLQSQKSESDGEEIDYTTLMPDYDYVEIDKEAQIKKINETFGKNFDVSKIDISKDISVENKTEVEELIKALPINEIGTVEKINFLKNSNGSNMLEIMFVYNDGVDFERKDLEGEYNVFLLQTLIKDAHIVNINSNLGMFMGGYDYYKETFNL